jgi:hypothetical protein
MKATQLIVIILIAFFSNRICAMSPAPDSYTPAEWSQHADAEKDAGIAIAHKDFRLLAYATRGIIVPGIEQEKKALLSQKCGLRMLEGFGDVVRSQAQLQAMKAMHDYAATYNKIVAEQCSAVKIPGK